MRVLAIDTETSGIPVNHLPPSDPAQPRIVQFAAVLLDADRREMTAVKMLINPGVSIPKEATRVHGIDDATAATFGVNERAAVGLFMRLCAVADVLIGHNLSFDIRMLQMAATRAKSSITLPSLIRCTCEASAPIVNLPPTQRMLDAGINRPKSPKLEEAYRALLGREMDGAHDAMADVRACIEIYFELLGRGAWKEAA